MDSYRRTSGLRCRVLKDVKQSFALPFGRKSTLWGLQSIHPQLMVIIAPAPTLRRSSIVFRLGGHLFIHRTTRFQFYTQLRQLIRVYAAKTQWELMNHCSRRRELCRTCISLYRVCQKLIPLNITVKCITNWNRFDRRQELE